MSVFRYELAERRSSLELTGIMRLISSTVHEHTMEGIIYGVYDVNLGKNRILDGTANALQRHAHR